MAEDRRPTRTTRAGTQVTRRPQSGGTDAKSLSSVSAPRSSSTVTTRVAERLSERARARARQRRVTFARRGLYIGLVAAAVWAALWSPLFALDSTSAQVSGHGSVVDTAQVDALIATHDGTSLVLLNSDHLARQLAELNGVREAQVERVWPRGLLVTLVPREPVAAIPRDDGSVVLVDVEGVEVATAAQAPQDLPVIDVPVGTDNVRILDAVLVVVSELPVELRDRVEGISAQTEDSVQFTLRDGPRVEWGSAEESALKAQVLVVMLESEDAESADVIDVSAPTLPITRQE